MTDSFSHRAPAEDVPSPEDVEATRHWKQSLWDDAANHLKVAHEAIEHAQGCFEDAGEQGASDQLQSYVDDLTRAANEAAEHRVR